MIIEGADSVDQCKDCDAGFYCPDKGQESVDKTNHICKAGYFCPKGSSSEDSEPCPIGHYCPANSGQVIL